MLNLPLHGERVDETYEVEKVELWLVSPTTPRLKPTMDVNPADQRARTGSGGDHSKLASEILQGGVVTMAVIQASSYMFVDIAGVPVIESFHRLKSLITDSWIVTSNSLSLAAGKIPVENAVVRALIMLVSKRLLGIKQLGAVSKVLTLLNFVKLASEAMRSANPELAETLSQISAVPILLYTSLARIVVDKITEEWLSQFKKAHFKEMISSFQIGTNPNQRIGKNGLQKKQEDKPGKLKESWAAFLGKDANAELREYVTRHAPDKPKFSNGIGWNGPSVQILSEFYKNFV